MVKWLTTLLAFIIPVAAVADDALMFRTGVGAATNRKSALFSIAYQNSFYDNFFYKFDGGAWTDSAPNQSGAPFVSGLLGYRFGNFDGFNFTPAIGGLVMGYPDGILGSPANFTEEVMLGYKGVGIGWKHVSNGNTSSPNLGRDYVFFNLTLPLSR